MKDEAATRRSRSTLRALADPCSARRRFRRQAGWPPAAPGRWRTAPPPRRAQRGERRAHQDARDRRADGPAAKTGRDHALDAVGGQQLFGRQDPRAGSRCTQGRRTPPRRPSPLQATAMMPDPLARQPRPSTAIAVERDHVDGLGGDDDRALFDAVRGDPADQDECDEGRRPRQVVDESTATRDRCRVRSPEAPSRRPTCPRRRSTATPRRSAGGTRGTGMVRARAIGRRRPPAARCRIAYSHNRWSRNDGPQSTDFRARTGRQGWLDCARPASEPPID